MTTRDEVADLIHDHSFQARSYSEDAADAILAAFDVTPKSLDQAAPPAETFNAITDWREPVPGWETLTYKTPGSAVVTREYTVPKGQ